MKHLYLPSLFALGLATCFQPAIATPVPVNVPFELAQTEDNLAFNLNSAKNLARQAIEEAYGGISNYVAEPSMHRDPTQSPYVENPDGSYTFTFRGRQPESKDFIYESVVTVATDNSVTLDYNGDSRGGTDPIKPVILPPPTLNEAKNLARQAAENKNGGLGNYRSEPSMHGNATDTPHVINEDGSYTFTFKGRRPESLDLTYESVVTVYPDRTTTVDSNTES